MTLPETPSPAPMRRWSPDALVRLLGFLFCLILSFAYAWTPIGETDTWYHLAAGRWMTENRAIYMADEWSFTFPGGRLISHEWLFQIVLYLVWSAGGYTGLAAFKAGLIFASLLALMRLARVLGAPMLLFLPLLGLTTWLGVYRFMDRPHMVTFLCAALALSALESAFRHASSPGCSTRALWRHAWWLLPTFWLWGQCHAGIVYGYGILGAYGIDLLVRQRRGETLPFPVRSYIVFALLCGAASLAGPNHIFTPLYPLEVLPKLRAAGLISLEFRSGKSAGMKILGWLVAAITVGWLLLLGRRPLREVLVAGGLGGIAFRWVRERGFFLLLMTPFLADFLAQTCGKLVKHFSVPPRHRRTGAIVLCGLLWIPAMSLTMQNLAQRSAVVGEPFILSRLPVRAIEFHEKHDLPVKAFHPDLWGPILIWKGRERIKTFVDVRAELWPVETHREYGQIVLGGSKSLELLDKWGAQSIFLDYSPAAPSRAGGDQYTKTLQNTIWSSPDWALVYWDDVAMLYIRREELAARPGLRSWEAISPDDLSFTEVLKSPSRTAAAIEELREAVALLPHDSRPLRMLGHLSLRAGNPEEAIKALTAQVRNAGATASDHEGLAHALDAVNRPEDAFRAVQAGLSIDPEHAGLLDLGGILLAQSGQVREGAAWLERAARTGPSDARREANLARMLEQLGEHRRAAQHADRARNLNAQTTGAL